jgi:hypothetical protein
MGSSHVTTPFTEVKPMPRSGFLVAVLLATAAACRELPQAPSSPLFSHQPIILDNHVPISFEAINPCTGELVSASGFLHLKFSITEDPNFHTSAESNVESAQGVTITGVRYVALEPQSSHVIIDSDFAPANGTGEHTLQLIRQAEDGTLILGDDFYLRIKAHVTINADGNVTVEFLDQTIECR